MAFYQRIHSIVSAFQVPLWGKKSEEDVPAWLVERLLSRELHENESGGLTLTDRWGTRSCAAGDWVVLREDGDVEFCRMEEFAERFHRLRGKLAA